MAHGRGQPTHHLFKRKILMSSSTASILDHSVVYVCVCACMQNNKQTNKTAIVHPSLNVHAIFQSAKANTEINLKKVQPVVGGGG